MMNKSKIYKKGVGFMPDYHLPSPSYLINRELVKGGVAAGSIMQIGSSQAGAFKTSHLIQFASNMQKGNVLWEAHVKNRYDLPVAYIDAEGAVDNFIDYDHETLEPKLVNPWFEGMGFDVNEAYMIEANKGELLWEAAKDLITYNGVKFVIMDSIHAVQPTSVHESEAGDGLVMAHAKLHTTELVKILPILRENQAILAAVNHKKVNMTPMGARGERYGGGKAWELYSKYIFTHTLAKSKSQLEDVEMIPINITIEKSKGGKSFKTISTFATQSLGIQAGAELVNLALESGIIRKSGGWYKSAEGDTIGQGMNQSVIDWCLEHKDKILEYDISISTNESK